MLKQRLDQRQVQKLILAPALQQAIKLLPLTNLELIEVIDEEVSQNPMIELEEETSEKDEAPQTEADEPLPEPGPETAAGETSTDDFLSGIEGDVNPDSTADFQDYLDDGFRPNFVEKKDALTLENTLSRSPSLWDHLNWQATLTFFDGVDLEIAEFIIGNINADGYLGSSVEEIANLCPADPVRVENVRKIITAFDPVGVGSLNLREALLAQLDHLAVHDDIARTIVNDHLDLVEKSDFSHLAKILGIPLQDVKVHIDIIRSLDPSPGSKYSEEKTTYVVPDIVVTKEGDQWKVTLNDEGLPRLRISSYYRQLLAKSAGSQPDANRFLKDRLKKALWFLRSLNQRNQTIYRVARLIVDRQKDFLENGIDCIKSLTLVEIAQEIGVHESTVGRVVANKYMMTPSGVFPLKYFFHKSLHDDSGEDVSSLKVKDKIRKLVDQEDKANPLSDIEIGDILTKDNLKIARRTVAKYRNQLKILPSHIRKRKFSMEGKA